nr:GntR family transcriptional regulator [uncultured Sellimonas sp.]
MQKKYEKIINWIQDEIRGGKLLQGNKLPSENCMMAQFQVSRQTVRRAMEVLEEKGIVDSRQGSGTYITVNTRRYTGREIRIAVMLTFVDTYIFPELIKGIETVLSNEGCTLQIVVTNNAVEKERMILKDFLRTQSVDGVIAETVKSALPNPNLELYRELEKKGIPTLFVNSFYRELDIPHVSLDDKKAGYLATKHLIECGHIRIGGIFKADDGQGHLRYAGYIQAMMEKDIRVHGENIIWIDSEQMHDMDEENLKFLKRMKDCTACVCYNDEIACKLINDLRKKGIKIPKNISVVGIDNSEMTEFCPVPLTSVQNPVEDLGKMAAESIVRYICHQEKPETVEFEPKLIVRNSVQII